MIPAKMPVSYTQATSGQWTDVEGEVIVEAIISNTGRAVATKIAQSSGYAGMDSEAMLAVARVSWKPARRNGVPVTATVRVPVVFAKN